MTIVRGKNANYGNYELNVFPSAFVGSVHVFIDREGGSETETAARVAMDMKPKRARMLAVALMTAADQAERRAREDAEWADL